jgi:hypothetical protein
MWAKSTRAWSAVKPSGIPMLKRASVLNTKARVRQTRASRPSCFSIRSSDRLAWTAIGSSTNASVGGPRPSIDTAHATSAGAVAAAENTWPAPIECGQRNDVDDRFAPHVSRREPTAVSVTPYIDGPDVESELGDPRGHVVPHAAVVVYAMDTPHRGRSWVPPRPHADLGPIDRLEARTSGTDSRHNENRARDSAGGRHVPRVGCLVSSAETTWRIVLLPSPTRPAQVGGDVEFAVFAESIERAIAAVYEALSTQGVLADDVLPIALQFRDHHDAHADVFGVLAGEAASSKANQLLVDELLPVLAEFGDQAAVLGFVLGLENRAAATYAGAFGSLIDAEAIERTASILPVTAAHAALLGRALGRTVDEQFLLGPSESTAVADGFDVNAYPVT